MSDTPNPFEATGNVGSAIPRAGNPTLLRIGLGMLFLAGIMFAASAVGFYFSFRTLTTNPVVDPARLAGNISFYAIPMFAGTLIGIISIPVTIVGWLKK